MRPARAPGLLTRARLVGEATVDLVLAGGCGGCQAPGPLLCAGCRALLRGPARPAWPSPSPAGLPQPWAVAPYDGAVRGMIVAHKEEGRLALARPLGEALATAVRGGLAGLPPGGRAVLLVPVPSRRSAVRARGHDPTLRMARRAAAVLRRQGVAARVLPVVRVARRLADQSGLGAAARAANLAGALVVPARLAPLVAGRSVLVVDDVITTGASLAETARALRASGADVLGAAVVAATVRRTARPDQPHLPLRSAGD